MKLFTLFVFLITMAACFLARRFAQKTVEEKGKRMPVYLWIYYLSLILYGISVW